MSSLLLIDSAVNYKQENNLLKMKQHTVQSFNQEWNLSTDLSTDLSISQLNLGDLFLPPRNKLCLHAGIATAHHCTIFVPETVEPEEVQSN